MYSQKIWNRIGLLGCLKCMQRIYEEDVYLLNSTFRLGFTVMPNVQAGKRSQAVLKCKIVC